jgi:hypothetical protein
VGHLQQKQNQQVFILTPKSKSKDDEQHVLMFLKPHNNLQIPNLAFATGDWRNPITEI